ncbi:MAG: adenosylcobinamide-GDP ribazoletransferase [Clostridium sp.]
MKSLYNALNMAISMFTIIPLPKYEWDEKSARHMMKFYPIIGLIIGLLWYGAFIVLDKLQCSVMLSSAILMAVPFVLTGFLHLDGFMDVCDALLSRRPKEDKLKILKDSRVGAFSVISLVLVFIIEFSAINTILVKESNMIFLILIPVISRSIVAYLLITKEMISESYLGKLFKAGTGTFDKVLVLSFYFTAIIISFILIKSIGIVIPLVMGLLAFLLVRNTEKELGGINGDVAGYILVLTEFVGLIALGIIK